MSFLGGLFGPVCEIDVLLNDAETRKTAELKTEDGKVEKNYLFYDGESVSGKVNLNVRQTGKRLEHQGIRIEFVGQIELFSDKSNTHEFVNLVKELALPGELTQNRSYDFEFTQVEKPYESYVGTNVRLRYFLKVTVMRRLSDLVKEYELIVHQLATYPDVNNSIKMEVGIEDCLHIEFEYNKSKYHLKDVIVGKIYFLLVRIKIQHMELQLIKKEMTGIGPSTTTETDTVAKYDIMDGAPVKGESIPIRLFLAGYDLTATMRDVNKKFSVRYFLNLVLVDEEDRRYFKQQVQNIKADLYLPVCCYCSKTADTLHRVEYQTEVWTHLLIQGFFFIWSGVKLSAMNHSLPSGSLAVQQTNLDFADARRMLPAPMHIANCKVWWRRNNGLGLFFMIRALSSSEWKC
uniref:VPS26, retromer complex component A n=1 Tax=Oncorhynchus mykiss TaxID=8022 RepID=A0A8C7TS17_ONCMY